MLHPDANLLYIIVKKHTEISLIQATRSFIDDNSVLFEVKVNMND